MVNAILPVGYSDKEVNIKHILINPIVKQAGITRIIERFNKKDTALYQIIQDRKGITHRLSFESQDIYFRPRASKEEMTEKKFRSWCDNWRKEIESYAEKTMQSTKIILKINNLLSLRIIKYKESIQK